MKRIVFGVMVAILVLLVVQAMSLSGPSSAPSTARAVTIDGSDGQGGMIDPINVWGSYTLRNSVVARLHPGDRVSLLRRDGDGVLIQTQTGVQGWVTYSPSSRNESKGQYDGRQSTYKAGDRAEEGW